MERSNYKTTPTPTHKWVSCFPQWLIGPYKSFPTTLGTSITAQHPQHNLYIRVESVGQTTAVGETGDRYRTPVTVHVKTIKEGSIAENIELLDETETHSLSILVTARVLHANQGNPLLKDGVHMLSHEHQDESEYTEWPGHGRAQQDDDEDS